MHALFDAPPLVNHHPKLHARALSCPTPRLELTWAQTTRFVDAHHSDGQRNAENMCKVWHCSEDHTNHKKCKARLRTSAFMLHMDRISKWWDEILRKNMTYRFAGRSNDDQCAQAWFLYDRESQEVKEKTVNIVHWPTNLVPNWWWDEILSKKLTYRFAGRSKDDQCA